MKFQYTILEWIELITPKNSVQDAYDLAVDGIIPWELFVAICKAAGQCVGV